MQKEADKRKQFSWGPRNCIGKNLALMEIRLIVALLLFHFDLELEKESKNWLKEVKAVGFFVRLKLMVKLTAVH
jgi:cytochrome P450